MKEYPDPREMRTIRVWKFTKPGSFEEFMEYVRTTGKYWCDSHPFGWWQRGRTYWVSTGGWSGNEEILSAMQSNFMFWATSWVSVRRGGHYVFTIPKKSFFETKKVRVIE